MDTVNEELFGVDPKIEKSIQFAKNISISKAPILIVGEIGVGKKSLAKYIHANSNRVDGEFKLVDCALDPMEVEKVILGHRYEDTGRYQKGILELANGGTVVLSNIDALEEVFQKKLHKIFNELEDYDIDIRIVATTTKNISKLVGSGRFYRGLYTYISSNSIYLSPLRERTLDIEMMAKHYISEYNIANGKAITINEEALRKITGHYWTHNVQELKTVIEASLNNCETDTLTDDDLTIGEKRAVMMIAEDDSEGIRLMSLKEAEKLLIKKALIHTSENRTQAAKILGVSIRTLRNKINEYRNGGSAYFINLR